MRKLAAALAITWTVVATAHAETTIKVGWCANTVSAAASPFAVAMKLGYFAEGGVKVSLNALPGATACVKQVATGELLIALPSIEPVAIVHPQGVNERMFYNAYQSYHYGIAVPADSAIHGFADLKGKTIGVISMDSGGVVVARALAATAGLNPNSDIRVVVAGEGAQTAALMRSKQVDALSQFDTQYAMVENAGVKLRVLDNGPLARFPGNGFVALEETLKTHRAEAVALGRGFAMGTVFAIANPEAAIRIMYEVFPQTKPTGKDDATAIADDTRVLQARAAHWSLESGGVTRWGECSMKNFDDYLEFLATWKVVPQRVNASDVVTNELIDDINKFDQKAVAARAQGYTF